MIIGPPRLKSSDEVICTVNRECVHCDSSLLGLAGPVADGSMVLGKPNAGYRQLDGTRLWHHLVFMHNLSSIRT